MIRSHRPLLASLFIMLPACSGVGGNPEAASPQSSTKATDKHESIGDLAASQGGLAALGGAGNREEGGEGIEVTMTGPLRLETLSTKSPPKLDGLLKEWHARTPERERMSGKTDGLGLDVAVQAGDETLWFAAEIADATLTRSAKHDGGEDHVTMTIAFPSRRGALKAYEIGFWPGIPGNTSGAVKWTSGPNAGRDVAGAKIVENDVKGGVTIEATVPWKSFPEADSVRVGMRAAFRYHDGDGSKIIGIVGTASGSVDQPGDLPALPIAAEQAVVDGLLEPKGLAGTKPKLDVYADIAGDERQERISVFGHFLTICGPSYRKGHQFFWREVTGDIVSIEPTQVTGRAKTDLVVRRRTTEGSGTHDVLEVWSLPSTGDEPTTVFAHEIAIASSDGKKQVTNAVRLSTKEIEVSTQPAVGWDAKSFNETLAGDTEPLLLPWGTVKSRTFKLDGTKYVKASEVLQAGTASPARTTTLAAEPAMVRDLPSPTVKRGSDLGKQVLAAYFKDAGLAAGTKPRFDLEVHVDGDPKPERVSLFGRDVVVLGPSFKNGTGYARMSLTQFADDKDIFELTARDLNGDGAAEIVVRGARHLKSSAGDDVAVDGLFVYQVKSGSIVRVFAIETGREMSGKRVQGLVQFIPSKSGRGFDIDARPGTAKGWTSETYPWPEDKPATGAIEPLLLPWGSLRSARYSWNGTQFALP